MYKKNEVLERIEILKTEAPAMASQIMLELDAAVDAYFNRDEEFTRIVKYTIHHIIYDTELRSYKYKNSENAPVMSENYPKGFEDVTILFDTEGALEELMTIDIDVYKAAFVVFTPEAEEGSETPPTPIMTNPYVVSWIERITAAITKEYEGLKLISAFCEDCGYDIGLFMYCEDYYEAYSPYKVKDYSKNDPDLKPTIDEETGEVINKEGIVKKIFNEMGYGLIKETFELEMYVPNCLKS